MEQKDSVIGKCVKLSWHGKQHQFDWWSATDDAIEVKRSFPGKYFLKIYLYNEYYPTKGEK